jgi:uncharacterized membrane protein YjgN (DUF898 family)
MESVVEVRKKDGFFYSFGYFLIIFFTATLAFPWAFMRYHGWLTRNTKINGKKIVFNGRTKHLYLIYFTGILYAVITFFAYTFITALISVLLERNGYKTDFYKSMIFKTFSALPMLFFILFITSRFYKYRANHTHFVDEETKESGTKLNIPKILIASIIFKILTVISFVLCYPFAMNIRERFLVSRRYIDGEFLRFKGSIGRICLIWYLGILLSIITLGFYIPYLFFKINKHILTNTELKNKECFE